MDQRSYDDRGHTREQTAYLKREKGLALPSGLQERYVSHGSFRIHLDEVVPTTSPRGTVILLHGAGLHGRGLMLFAPALVEAGFRVIAPDLPGYGLTEGDCRGVTYADWIELVSEMAVEAATKGPVVLYGMSAGGAVALLAAQRSGVASAVVATTLLDLADPTVFAAAARHPRLARLARPWFRFDLGPLWRLSVPLRWLVPIERLTSDPSLARMLRRDPLVGGLRRPLGWFRSIHAHPLPSRLDPGCPVLLAHPGADRWTPLALSLPTYDRLEGPKELVVLSGGSHAPLEQPAHEELASVVVRFLDRRVPRAVSDAPASA